MGHETKGKLYPINEAYALVDDTKNFISKIKPIQNLRFSLDSLTLQPFYELHDARYQMYFQTFTKAEFDEQKTKLKLLEAQNLGAEKNTVDYVNCGEQQPEVDHNYKGEKSDSGYEEGLFWRNTRSFVSYQFSNKNLDGKFIEVTILDNFIKENIQFQINGNIAEMSSIENKIIKIKAPDSEIISLTIKALNERSTQRIHKIRLIKQ